MTARYGIFMSLFLSLWFWGVWAFFIWKITWMDLYIAILFYFLMTFVALFVVENICKVTSQSWAPISLSFGEMFVRWGIAFFVVFGISYYSQFLPPVRIWIFTMFPATFLSTFYILHTRRWSHFSQATAKVFLLSVTNLLVYALLIWYMYPLYWILIWTIVWCIWSLVRTLGMKKIINTLS